jgi:AraC-like DNA-binding protein
VAEVSETLGFQHPSAFTHPFHREVGVARLRYRQGQCRTG